jgi:GNAT superfamily N-acetyltransferase
MEIAPLKPSHLTQLQRLINSHLDAVVPGWALPAAYIEQRLQSHPDQYILDPWVQERVTLAAVEEDRLLAAAHLLHYGNRPPVGEHYRNVMDIGWFLARPDEPAAGEAILEAAGDYNRQWQVARSYIWDFGLPVRLSGVPDSWPHIVQALKRIGFSDANGRVERLYGGPVIPHVGEIELPVAGLVLEQQTDGMAAAFRAVLDGRTIGHCNSFIDLTHGGVLPAFRGWGELEELAVDVDWQGRGVGAWLVRHAVRRLSLAGCDRLVLTVDLGDEARGAGRFYRRFGWDVLATFRKGWQR